MSALKPSQLSGEDRLKEEDNGLVYSYLTLRNLIGFSGILLPVVLVVTTSRNTKGHRIWPSISDYYYSSNGDILVVLLSVLGVFLFTYKGYTTWERGLTITSAIGAIGIGFWPMSVLSATNTSIHRINEKVPELLTLEWHFIFAILFFLSSAIICLKYFPRTDTMKLKGVTKRTQKQKRNLTYSICGWTMIGCLAALLAYCITGQQWFPGFPFIFVAETIAIWAFGFAWITKGETLWPDDEHYIKRAYKKWKQKPAPAVNENSPTQ